MLPGIRKFKVESEVADEKRLALINRCKADPSCLCRQQDYINPGLISPGLTMRLPHKMSFRGGCPTHVRRSQGKDGCASRTCADRKAITVPTLILSIFLNDKFKSDPGTPRQRSMRFASPVTPSYFSAEQSTLMPSTHTSTPAVRTRYSSMASPELERPGLYYLWQTKCDIQISAF